MAKETSENKPQRDVAQIQQEYTGLALRAGQLQYQIFTFKRDLELLNQQMRDLNFEAAASKARDDQKAAEEAMSKQETGNE